MHAPPLVPYTPFRSAPPSQTARSSPRLRQHRLAPAIANNPVPTPRPASPPSQTSAALNLRQNVSQMMRHHHQPRTFPRQPPQGLAQLSLRRQIQRIRRLIQKVVSACAPAPAQSGSAASPPHSSPPPSASPGASPPSAPEPPTRAPASPAPLSNSATASTPKRTPPSPRPAPTSPPSARPATPHPSSPPHHPKVLPQLRQIPPLAPKDPHPHPSFTIG
jgi:hypothetical protein